MPAKARVGQEIRRVPAGARGIRIPHNTTHAILEAHGLARRDRPGQRRSFVGHGRAHTNPAWHGDWKQLKDGRRLIAYEGDASRLITGYGVFEHATSANAVKVLRGAIAEHGKPASVLTDHGAQSCATGAESRRRGATEFENFLVANGIRHVLARVRHPQTNGKTGRFFGVLTQKIHLFVDIDELVAWRDTVNPHMALNAGEPGTPCEALGRKMAPPGAATAADEEAGEEYAVSWQPPSGGPGRGDLEAAQAAGRLRT